MKYALLVYLTSGLLEGLSPEDRRSLHNDHQAAAPTAADVIAHYKVRPPQLTTTVRLDGDQIVRTEGASPESISVASTRRASRPSDARCSTKKGA